MKLYAHQIKEKKLNEALNKHKIIEIIKIKTEYQAYNIKKKLIKFGIKESQIKIIKKTKNNRLTTKDLILFQKLKNKEKEYIIKITT
jgi:hypothetical protein